MIRVPTTLSNVEEPFDAFDGKEFFLRGSWWPDRAQKY
jgi:hypothetical protein